MFFAIHVQLHHAAIANYATEKDHSQLVVKMFGKIVVLNYFSQCMQINSLQILLSYTTLLSNRHGQNSNNSFSHSSGNSHWNNLCHYCRHLLLCGFLLSSMQASQSALSSYRSQFIIFADDKTHINSVPGKKYFPAHVYLFLSCDKHDD